ncbi:TfoX/Sxy family protein [Dethiothermospora halolimnae]|uniref:TfoX/Sxy family protein n=1 Tax=Dethiothermospora halolimnae TaxID=3114390 RepID=UPI003CCC36C8
MGQLSKLPNIGKILEEKLNNVGINTKDELYREGSKEVFLRIKNNVDNNVCLNMLYALEGAIQGIRWYGLSNGDKEKLKEFYNYIK